MLQIDPMVFLIQVAGLFAWICLAAAVYGASEGLKTVLIESTTTGGQAGRSSRIENYLGFEMGISGAELTTSARRQAERFTNHLLTDRVIARPHIRHAGENIDLAVGFPSPANQRQRAGGHHGCRQRSSGAVPAYRV